MQRPAVLQHLLFDNNCKTTGYSIKEQITQQYVFFIEFCAKQIEFCDKRKNILEMKLDINSERGAMERLDTRDADAANTLYWNSSATQYTSLSTHYATPTSTTSITRE